MLNANLLRALVLIAPTDSASVHQVDFHRRRLEQLPESIALLRVFKRKERVRSRNTQELAGLGRASRGCAARLTQHEISRGLMTIELRDTGNNIVVAIENQQKVGLADFASVHRPCNVCHPDNCPSILSIARVIKIELPSFILRDVFEIGVLACDCEIDRRLIVLIKRERLSKAAVLCRVDLAARHQREKVVLHRRRVVLLGKSRGGLARSRKPDDQTYATENG